MSLSSFHVDSGRTMPIFVLADVSGSMIGQKIDTLNVALREMTAGFRQATSTRHHISVSILTFGEEVQVLVPLTPVDDIQLPQLSARGPTPLGQALTMVRELIEDEVVVPPSAYRPTIILVSDGMPTDVSQELREVMERNSARSVDYLEWAPLSDLHASLRGGKAVRLALAVGSDASDMMLDSFINTPGVRTARAGDATGISKFFQWLTMSMIDR